ncbi:MAG TPA: hypothetical protein VFZ58_00580 [Candidatus Saccharimonadales bacterium]
METVAPKSNPEQREYLFDCEKHVSIKQTLHRLAPLPSEEEQALRGEMLDAARNKKAMRSLFPATRFSEATEHFLQLIADVEINIAQTVLCQQALLKENPKVFLASLCGDLTEEERALCFDQFDHLQEPRLRIERFLRRLNGEPALCIAADHHVTDKAIFLSLKRTAKKWFNNEPIQAITERLTPRFPRYKKSLVEDLPTHLPYINQEISRLAERLTEPAFAQLVLSLVDTNMTSCEALLVLAKCNSVRLTHLADHHPLRTMSKDQRRKTMKRYQAHANFLQSFQPRSDVYENGDEAGQIIQIALATYKTGTVPSLSSEQVVYYAKDIEAGVYAEKLLEQNKPHAAASAEELQQLVELGKAAMQHLLVSHVDHVILETHEMKLKMKSQRDTDALVLVGMRGLLRAIRKYDYRKNTMFSGSVLRKFITRDIIQKDWRVSIGLGERIISLQQQRKQLTKSLRTEPPLQTLATYMKLPVGALEKLLQEEEQIKKPPAR